LNAILSKIVLHVRVEWYLRPIKKIYPLQACIGPKLSAKLYLTL